MFGIAHCVGYIWQVLRYENLMCFRYGVLGEKILLLLLSTFRNLSILIPLQSSVTLHYYQLF
jgi:hypothetical protein